MTNTSKQSKKIRKGDQVVVIAGNNAGKTGTVLSCKDERILIQGVNIRKKHVKPNQLNQKGGVLEVERPLHVSNVKPCNAQGVPVKLKVRTGADGEKELFYRQNGQEIAHRSLKKS